jgi:hypothetical protein
LGRKGSEGKGLLNDASGVSQVLELEHVNVMRRVAYQHRRRHRVTLV